MIVLDTNVVSEAMKAEPHPSVRAWLNDQAAETLYLSSVTLAELLFGIAALPAGKRKDMLTQTLDGLLGLFRDRVLPVIRLLKMAFSMKSVYCNICLP
jgi:predicted nucleic acid-binding protein